MVNSAISLLLETLGGGQIAFFTSSALIVIFGEIVPQAICSRHGLGLVPPEDGPPFTSFFPFPLSLSPLCPCFQPSAQPWRG